MRNWPCFFSYLLPFPVIQIVLMTTPFSRTVTVGSILRHPPIGKLPARSFISLFYWNELRDIEKKMRKQEDIPIETSIQLNQLKGCKRPYRGERDMLLLLSVKGSEWHTSRNDPNWVRSPVQSGSLNVNIKLDVANLEVWMGLWLIADRRNTL